MDTNIEIELNILAADGVNLSDVDRILLHRVVERPTQETWDAAYEIQIGNVDGQPLALWQAVSAVNPHMPSRLALNPSTGRPDWPTIPTQFQLVQAIRNVAYGLLVIA